MTYVLSDIHGAKRRLTAVLDQIDLKPHDRLYVIGDVIDRNPDGIEILRDLLAMENATLLLGNHEAMMIDALSAGYDFSGDEPRFADRDAWARWAWNGGDVTVEELMEHPRSEIDRLVRKLDELPLTAEVEVNGRTFLLAHGCPLTDRERIGCSKQRERALTVWGRVTPETALFEDKTVVFGHTPTICYQDHRMLSFWYGEKRIGIDCGAAFGDFYNDGTRYHGRLGCLRLDDMKEFYSD